MLDLMVARVTGRQVPTPHTSGGAQVLGLIIKDLPTNSADGYRKENYRVATLRPRWPKSPEQVADFHRNTRPASTGMRGRLNRNRQRRLILLER